MLGELCSNAVNQVSVLNTCVVGVNLETKTLCDVVSDKGVLKPVCRGLLIHQKGRPS